MAQEDVDIKVNADDGGAQQMLERLAMSFEKIADRSGKASQKASEGLAKWAGDAGKVATGMLGVQTVTGAVHTALGLLRAEIDQVLNRQKRAGKQFASIAEAEQALMLAVGPDKFVQERDTLLRDSAKRGVDPRAYIQSSIGGYSARQDLPAERVSGMMDVLARQQPALVKSGQGKEFLEGMLVAAKDHPKATDEQLYGFVSNSFGSARNVDPATVGRVMIPAASLLRRQFGGEGDLAEYQGFLTGIGHSIEDPTGDRAKTMAPSMMRQIQDAGMARGVKPGFRDIVSGRFWETKEGAEVRKELLGFYSGDADAKKKAGMHLEAQTSQAGYEFLQGQGTPTNRNIQRAMAAIPGVESEETLRRLRASNAELAKSPYQRVYRAGEAFEGGRIAAQSSSETDATAGMVAEQLEQGLGDYRVSHLKERIINTTFKARALSAKNPEEVYDSAIGVLEDSKFGTKPRQNFGSLAAHAIPFVGGELSRALQSHPDASTLKSDDKLDEMIGVLKDLRDAARNPPPVEVEVKSNGEYSGGVVRSKISGAGQRPNRN